MFIQYKHFWYWFFLLFIPVIYLLLSRDEVLPVNFCEYRNTSKSCQSTVEIYANRLSSEETLTQYEYNSFDFCSASVGSKSPLSSFGYFIVEKNIGLLPYEIKFPEDVKCATLCKKTYKLNRREDVEKLEALKKIILKNYQHYWSVDDMPVAWWHLNEGGEKIFSTGFPVGCYGKQIVDQHKVSNITNDTLFKHDTFYLFNHVDLMIRYESGEGQFWQSSPEDKLGRVVQVRVQPRSIKHQEGEMCNGSFSPLEIPDKFDPDNEIIINYTYSVHFVKDDEINWESRLDYLLRFLPYVRYQSASIGISFCIVLLLIGAVMKVLHEALPNIMQKKRENDPAWVEFSLKLLCTGALKPPKYPMLLSVLLGNGVQILFATFCSLACVSLGYMSPFKNNEFATFAVMLYAFLGAPATFLSITLYKAFGGRNSLLHFVLSATLCPGLISICFSVMNFVLWNKGSSATELFDYVSNRLFQWFIITLLFPFLGAYIGQSKEAYKDMYSEVYSIETDQLPTPSPHRQNSIWSYPIFGIILSGCVPFSCVYLEFVFILKSMWLNHAYLKFDYLLLDFIFLIIACLGTSLLFCFWRLQAGDYRWCWHSFFTAGCASFYAFAYSIYFFTELNATDSVSVFIYFGYTLITVFLFFLLTGCIGFFACYWFVCGICKEAEKKMLDQRNDDPPPYESI